MIDEMMFFVESRRLAHLPYIGLLLEDGGLTSIVQKRLMNAPRYSDHAESRVETLNLT